MSDAPQWARERAREIHPAIDMAATTAEAEERLARALAETRRATVADALRWIDAIHEGKDNSRDPEVVDDTCVKIRHGIRAIIYRAPGEG